MDDRKPPVAIGEAHPEESRPSAEAPDAREGRLRRERDLIEEARRDIREGRYIPDEQADEWLDRLLGDEPLPVPERPSKGSGRR